MSTGRVTYSQLGKNGRTGNQFFQLAATLAYSAEHGKDLIIPPWPYQKYFTYKMEEGILSFANDYQEPVFRYCPIPFIDGDVNLNGYFQSEKYFKEHEALIRGAFDINQETFDTVQRKFMTETMDYQHNTSWCQKRICAIHVRRGDYVSSVSTGEYHGVLTPGYYHRAAHELYGDTLEHVLFYVFSDDPQWCKNNLHFRHVIYSENELDIIDLFKMARCQDFIIANSSFSWWGAWLSETKDKRVVAPINWFNAPLDATDIYCENWIKL